MPCFPADQDSFSQSHMPNPLNRCLYYIPLAPACLQIKARLRSSVSGLIATLCFLNRKTRDRAHYLKMDSPEDSKIIADRLAKERHQMPQVPMAYKNGRQWHSRTRPEPAYLAHRPRRLPNQHGAVGDGLPLPQKSVSAAGSARQEPEKDWTPYKLKASPHLADFFSSDDGHVATTLAELVASSDPEEEPMSEISAPVITPSTSDGDPDPDSKGPTKVSQETEFLYIRDWKSALSYKHGPLTEIKLCRCFLHDCISSTKQPHEMARQDRGKEHKSRAMSNTSIVVYYL